MHKKTEQPDPIRLYAESTQHRYDPGYYLGGIAPPHLRKNALGHRARRFASLLIGIMAILSSGAAAGSLASDNVFVGSLLALLAVLTTAAAWRMSRA
jgi:hypothetical protein